MDPICPICGAQNFEKIGTRHHQKPARESNRWSFPRPLTMEPSQLRVAASLAQETDLLLSADDRGAQSVHWTHAVNCHSGSHGQVGSCTCSKGLFTRGHLENYTALLRTVEENQRSGESAGRQVYRPRLDRETVEAVSDFIGITTGDKAYQLQKIRNN